MTESTRRCYADVAHGQMHLITAGDPAARPLVLLHQVPSSARMWSAVLAPLARRGHHVVAVDLPGYGGSDPLPGRPELTGYAAAVTGVLDALGIGSAHLLGHHTGASVALTLAATAPDRVRSAALWGIPVLDPEFARELAAEPPPRHDDTFPDDVTGWWRSRAEHSVHRLRGPVLARSLAEMLQCGAHRPDGHNAVGRTDHDALLDRITGVPLLGLTGDREMLDAETRAVVAARPGQVELAGLGDVGMDVADEAPELLADTVTRFTDRAELLRDGGTARAGTPSG